MQAPGVLLIIVVSFLTFSATRVKATLNTDNAVQFALAEMRKLEADKPVEFLGVSVSNPASPKWTVDLKVGDRTCKMYLVGSADGQRFERNERAVLEAGVSEHQHHQDNACPSS